MIKTSMSSKLFVHKVLLSLQFLQGSRKNRCGVTARKISSYIAKHFDNDGDVASQVQASLDECVHYGFVEKCARKYLLVGPIASIQMQPHNSESRVKEVERIRKIFPYDWRPSKRKHRNRTCKCANRRGKLASLFYIIKNWLFGSRPAVPLATQPCCRRLINVDNVKRMKRRRHCSRSGCKAPYSTISCNTSATNVTSDTVDDLTKCEILKKKRAKLEKQACKIMEKYKKECEYNRSKRKKRRKRSGKLASCECP